MKSLLLPDLGEGLQEAEIVAWSVSPGQTVQRGDILVSVETAKALVDIPAPETGRILACHGQAGEVLRTGSPLVDYETDPTASQTPVELDHGSVVGDLPEHREIHDEGTLIIGRQRTTPEGFEVLHGLRRQMARNLGKAHQQVALVTLFDEVVVEKRKHLLARVLKAIVVACHHEPALNVWYHDHPPSRRVHEQVRIGLAIATSEGLLVPVLPTGLRRRHEWEEAITQLRHKAEQRELTPDEQHGATFTVSNFGMMGGRFATPMVSPPQVAILGLGQLQRRAGGQGWSLPLSLSFDHRAVTGAEAAHFLSILSQRLAR